MSFVPPNFADLELRAVAQLFDSPLLDRIKFITKAIPKKWNSSLAEDMHAELKKLDLLPNGVTVGEIRSVMRQHLLYFEVGVITCPTSKN